MATQITKKSGKGSVDGVVSELSLFFDVLPGHAEEIRAASQRLGAAVKGLDPNTSASTGLRDVRMVVFNNGQQYLFGTSFDTDWDAYIDDVFLVVGVKKFLDWTQHTVQGAEIAAWVESVGGADKMDKMPDEEVRKLTPRFKEILQKSQTPAAAYFNALSPYVLPQIQKALNVQQAFQQVLDNPAAAEALQNPALKPLLDQAAA